MLPRACLPRCVAVVIDAASFLQDRHDTTSPAQMDTVTRRRVRVFASPPKRMKRGRGVVQAHSSAAIPPARAGNEPGICCNALEARIPRADADAGCTCGTSASAPALARVERRRPAFAQPPQPSA
ncbi:hypothetical protein B0H10DRAFT_2231605 [Mycena sp. CBHHK59/15]|nr:hypothetical protein B0H10DRAFT_2231605 [Mycena sp. CBHHK59/15]